MERGIKGAKYSRSRSGWLLLITLAFTVTSNSSCFATWAGKCGISHGYVEWVVVYLNYRGRE